MRPGTPGVSRVFAAGERGAGSGGRGDCDGRRMGYHEALSSVSHATDMLGKFAIRNSREAKVSFE